MAELGEIVKSCLSNNKIETVAIPDKINRALPSALETEIGINNKLSEDEKTFILWRLSNNASLGIKNIEFLSLQWRYFIDSLQRLLQIELNTSKVNIYSLLLIAPESGWTRPPHSDAEMLIIMQLFGKKYWNIYNQIGRDGIAYSMQTLKSAKSFGGYLCAGNLLTVPKSFIHHANCHDKTMCIGLTIGVDLSKSIKQKQTDVIISLEETLSPMNKQPQEYQQLISKRFHLVNCEAKEHSLVYQKLKTIVLRFEVNRCKGYNQSNLQSAPKNIEKQILFLYINELPIGYVDISNKLVYIRPLFATQWIIDMIEDELKSQKYE
jgi:hypothetical protein